MTSKVPEAPPPAPVYKKWWFWVSIVGGVAVLGTGSYLLLRKPKRAVAGLARRGW